MKFNLNYFKNKKPSCLAPSTSMRFNHSGNVLACCFNRGYVLGKFPEQSISEIWFGDKTKKIQKAVQKSDFSMGCQACEKYIRCGNREASGAFQYDYLSNLAQHKKYPTMLDLELGSTCNFECIMCSGEYSSAIRVNREKKKAYYSPYEEHLELFIEQLIPFLPFLKEIRFLGGEPFLMRIYYKIWEAVIQINPSILLNVLTNASVLNSKVKTILEKGNFKIAVSIDSLEKYNFESIRKNGNFELVMKNIHFFLALMKNKNHVMNFNLCVMRQNWKEIPSYFDFCNRNEIKVILHSVMFPAHTALWNLPKEILDEIVKIYSSFSFVDEKNEVINENSITFNGLINQIKGWASQAKEAEIVSYEFLISELHSFEFKNNVEEAKIKRLENLLSPYDKEVKTKILNFLFKLGFNRIYDELEVNSNDRITERLRVLLKE